MTHKTMTVEEVIDYILNAETSDDFSFRGDSYIPARKFRNSHYHPSDVDDGEEFDLGGVSAIKVMDYSEQYIRDAAKHARRYGSNLFLLQGEATNAHEWANDPGEVLMASHKIICIVR
jgi:hypothetical protein